MLAWSEGTDNGRQKTRNHGYDVIAGGELFTDYLITSQTATLNPKLKSQSAGRLPASFPLVGCLPQAAWPERLLSEKSGRCGIAADGDVASPMIWSWWISVRQSTVAAISGLHCCRLWSPEHKADSLIAKFSEAANGQRDWCMSRVTAIISALLSASSSACHGLLIITVITPLPTKPSATKCQRIWSWRTRQLLTWCPWSLLRRCKIHEGVSWCCRVNTVTMRCRWSSSAAHQSSLSVSAWSHHRLRRG